MARDQRISMYELRNKNILILSPQDWKGQQISKHHYARALAKRGNKVLFVAAPRAEMGLFCSTYIPHEDLPLLQVADYCVPLPFKLSFHLPKLYRQINLWQVRKIINSHFKQLDICIDFGHYRFYPDLTDFNAPHKIFFPVDDFQNLKPDVRDSNLCFSVSKNIVDKFNSAGVVCHFMHHGLSDTFVKHIQQNKFVSVHTSKATRVGYAGNLMLRFLNRTLFRSVIEEFPEIEFHCFGNYKAENHQQEDIAWQNWLERQSNIRLYGTLNTETLAVIMQQMDVFWLCYQSDGKNYHAENSHKILEYLSTGKVVISTPISIYENTGLLIMVLPESYLSQFSTICNALNKYNSLEKQKARINYALQNTYEKQIKKICKYIN